MGVLRCRHAGKSRSIFHGSFEESSSGGAAFTLPSATTANRLGVWFPSSGGTLRLGPTRNYPDVQLQRASSRGDLHPIPSKAP